MQTYKTDTHIHTNTHIYIYIYVCVCVCVLYVCICLVFLSLVFCLVFVFLTDWNQGLFIAVACSSMFVCFTSSYRRDLCKVNWHIVKYLLHIVYKNILFWAIILHLILWQSMHFMRAFVCFYYYYTQWTANALVACICIKH